MRVWYTAPTALRMLLRAGPELAAEPLNAEVVLWSDRVWGRPVHDNWWQTETGAIMIANPRGTPIRPRVDGPAAPRHRGDRAAP